MVIIKCYQTHYQENHSARILTDVLLNFHNHRDSQLLQKSVEQETDQEVKQRAGHELCVHHI